MHRLGAHGDPFELKEASFEARRIFRPKDAQHVDPFLEASYALARVDLHRTVFGVEGALNVTFSASTTDAGGQHRSPFGDAVKGPPLSGKYHRMAKRKARHARGAELTALGTHCECGKQRHGLQARLRQQVVANPKAVECFGRLRAAAERQKLRNRRCAEYHPLIRQEQAKFHLVSGFTFISRGG